VERLRLVELLEQQEPLELLALLERQERLVLRGLELLAQVPQVLALPEPEQEQPVRPEQVPPELLH
jgi:hypothetical protein